MRFYGDAFLISFHLSFDDDGACHVSIRLTGSSELAVQRLTDCNGKIS